MSVLSNIIIVPVRNILEVFFTFFSESFSSGMAIVGLSFVVTICCLPLYVVAEQWQERERLVQRRLEPGIRRIRRAFQKDERYMMQSAFYAENHYHPVMALRSSFGLLIQIPFFIAAYSFLSGLGTLRGEPFLFIRDLGAPDALLAVGRWRLNVLPVAMTAINCVSGTVYSKGHGVREKAQIYGMALVFLLLLYGSPSGLVLYWTMNNVLSLVKNVFYKLRRPLAVFHAVAVLFFLCVDVWAVRSGNGQYMAVFIPCSVLVTFLPFLVRGADSAITTYLTPPPPFGPCAWRRSSFPARCLQ